ncbi:MAG: acyl-CoA dehydrogenase family protein [Pseudomonadota bacterium]|nr:acyl-CoA dehydrogenase family protein [Pseudomonadota bacterium]
MDMRPTERQQELVELARKLAREKFEPRAAELDREARFPFEDYDDLREAGLLALCIPETHGGLGGDLETYVLVAEQIAQGNASTALTYNMHCLTMLMMGEMADAYDMSDAQRARHETHRAEHFREVVENGVFYGQPHSEPVEKGQTDTAFQVGGRRFGTRAEKVAGGYRINGKKFFVSLSDAADYFATPAILVGDAPWIERTLYLKVPRQTPGLTFSGEWDPIGMRATVSRDMVLEDVFVADEAEVLPPGVFGGLYLSSAAHGPMLFSATFLGMMQRAYEFTLDYLTGGVDGASAKEDIGAVMSNGIADMLFKIESAKALYYRAASEAKLKPTQEIRQRARAAHIMVQRNCVEVAQEAIKICGGRALLKRFPLERYLRDAQAASVMRPWTREIATEAVCWSAIRMAQRKNGTFVEKEERL